jgi:hypothetical protein
VHRDFAEIQRQARVACAPEPGAPGAVLLTCRDCSAAFWDWRTKWRYRCPDCSADRGRASRAAFAAKYRVPRT